MRKQSFQTKNSKPESYVCTTQTSPDGQTSKLECQAARSNQKESVSEIWRYSSTKSNKIRIATLNLFFGAELNITLGAAQGYNPPLPSFVSLLIRASGGQVIPEVDVARMYEGLWQQANSELLFGTRSRLTAVANNLAEIDADIIGFQECAIISNNPVTNPDGTVRNLPYEINNGVYGREDSPETVRTFNFLEMIVQRLKDDHGLDYKIISQTIGDSSQGKRTLTTVAEARAILNVTFTNAVIAKKHVQVKYERNDILLDTPEPRPFLVALESNPLNPVEVGFGLGLRRGFSSLNLKVCGKTIRVINVHLQSGSNIPAESLFVDSSDIQIDHGAAGRAAQALQLLREEVIPSPYPVFLIGDLNVESLLEATAQNVFPVTAWQTLVGSVDESGNPTNDGGYMIDAGRAVHGNNITTPRFKTSSIAGVGLKWARMRNPASFFRIRIDHILYRRGDDVTPVDFDVSLPVPDSGGPPGSGPEQWAWPSDHNGVWADFKI